MSVSPAFRLGAFLVTIGASMAWTGFAHAAPLLAVDFNGPSWGFNATETGFTGIPESADLTAGFAVGPYTVKSSVGSRFTNGSFTDSGAFTYAELYRDHIYNNDGGPYAPDGNDSGNAIDIVLEGFAPNTQYELTFYGYDDGHSVTNKFWDTVAQTLLGSITWTAGSPPTSNHQYATTFNLTSDANGALKVTATGTWSSGYITRLSGFEVTAVPEPASLALAGAAGLLMLQRRRA